MRELCFEIFRFDPCDPASKPRLQEFRLDETPRMTLYTALSRIQEEQDGSLRFDFVCRSAFCGSCGVMVNGKPRLMCRTRTETLPEKITLLPLPFFQLLGDLSVDTGKWFREMGARVQSWIHTREDFNPAAEERMSNRQAQQVYELDRCIECGLCLAACASAQMRGDFLGAAAFVRLARFLADPRDTVTPDAMAAILERLQAGKALRKDSTEVLIDNMEKCRTGPNRIKGELPRGTPVAHKTGTFLRLATNDVGIVSLPWGGGPMIIAIYLKGTDRPLPMQERSVAAASLAVYRHFTR